MRNLLRRITASVRYRTQTLLSVVLFKKQGALKNSFGSFISPFETHVAGNLQIHENLRPLLDLMTSQEVDLPLVRLGSQADGGYVVIEKDYTDSFLISGGILDDNNFEIALANLGARVHQVDYTIAAAPIAHPSLTFSPQKLVGENQKITEFDISLDDLVATASGEINSELLLKLDIEGSEWEILETSSSLGVFNQIYLELHYLDRLADSRYAESSKNALNKLMTDFFPVFISGNNCCGFVTLGGYVLPRVMEMTLLNRKVYSPISDHRISINQKYQSQNLPDKAPLVLKRW